MIGTARKVVFGDAGVPGAGSDVSYTGETGESVLSLDYYRQKALEFQQVLNSLDAGAAAAQSAIEADVDDELTSDLSAMLDEWDGKKTMFRLTAEAINAGAAAVNALGGRFPELSIPSGLGLVPVLPLAAIAAFATAATLIAWGVTWLQGLNTRLARAQQLEAVKANPDKAAALAQAWSDSDTAVAAVQESPLSSIAGIVKWLAIGAGVWLAYKAFAPMLKGSSHGDE